RDAGSSDGPDAGATDAGGSGGGAGASGTGGGGTGGASATGGAGAAGATGGAGGPGGTGGTGGTGGEGGTGGTGGSAAQTCDGFTIPADHPDHAAYDAATVAGVVTDAVTGLTWQRATIADDPSWRGAAGHCAG